MQARFTARFALAVVVATLALLHGAAPAAQKQITLHLIDRGDDAARLRDAGRAGVEPPARFAVAMPREDFTAAQLRRTIYDDLKQRVDATLQRGGAELEVELVHDVANAGQPAKIEFGAAAYGALRDLGVELQRRNIRVTQRASVSNVGAAVLAANVDAWSVGAQAIWQRVDIFDSHAFLTPMVKVIDRIGARRVRLFDTPFDEPAPHASSVLRVLASAATSRELKDFYFADLKVYRLASVDRTADADTFHAEEYLGRATGFWPVPGKVAGAALSRGDDLAAPAVRSLPPKTADRIAVQKSIAHAFVDALGAYAGGAARQHGETHVLAHASGRAATVAKAIQAMNEDVVAAGDGRFVVIGPRTVEAAINIVIEEVVKSAPLRATYGKDVKVYTSSVSAVLEMLRSQEVNAAAVEKLAKGASVLAQHRLAQAHATDVAAKAARVAQVERDAARLAREQEQLARALFLAGRDRTMRHGAVQQMQSQLTAVTAKLAATAKPLDDARDLLRVARARFVLASIGLDVLPTLAGAVAEHVKHGSVNLEVGDRYADVFLTLTGSLVAAVIVATNPELAVFAPAIKEAVVAGGKVFNDVGVRPLFDHSFMWEALDAYLAHQAFAVRNGLQVETLSAFYGYDHLRAIGMTDNQIKAQDAEALRVGAAAAAHAAAKAPGDAQQNALVTAPATVEPRASLLRSQGSPRWPSQPPQPPTKPQRPDKPGAVEHADADKAPDTPKFPLAPLPRGGQTPPAPASADPNPCGPGGSCGGIDLGLVALVVDPATRRLVALAEGGTAQAAVVDPDLMALAVWLEYGGERAAFSLDPFDPKNPRGPWLRAVYFPAALQGTVAGNQCFDADFFLKQMSFGVRVEGNQVVERKNMGALQSLPALMSGQSGAQPEQWSRLWIVARTIHLAAGDGVVRVERAAMGVEARRQVPDASTRSGLRDVASPADGLEQRFARQFERHYEQLAATDAPSLAFVREAAKAIAVARWMRTNGVSVDMAAAVARLNRARVPAVEKVSALSVGWTSRAQTPYATRDGSGVRTTTRQLHVFGGIDLGVEPKIAHSRRDAGLRDAVAAKLAAGAGQGPFELAHAGRVYRAQVLPF